MNNYKFRGKTAEGEWVYGYYYENPNNGIYRIRWVNPELKEYFTEKEVRPESVGQFCGHDSNDDIDIYEKDIIQVWRHGQLMRTFLVLDIRRFLNEYKNDEHGAIWKIAGNLIDNPELLEGK